MNLEVWLIYYIMVFWFYSLYEYIIKEISLFGLKSKVFRNKGFLR